MSRFVLALTLTCCVGISGLYADDATTTPPADSPVSVEELSDRIRQSLVVIESRGRTGRQHGEGTGFAVGPDLIATARHVLGEGRPVSVLLPDGRAIPVQAVEAQTSHVDVAVLRTDPHGLPVLPLATEELPAGRHLTAMGHPHGLRNSVVDGVLSGRREIDGIDMLQLAMSIEPGNSGGPVVDDAGTVVGVVTLKSAVTDQIGFAVPARYLNELLTSPNPIPMPRWVTIGALDRKRWEVVGGASWTQRAGRILVSGSGTGFGGRTQCLQQTLPELPVEVEVEVRLTDESGAAGLVFQADGTHRHYGFYPSAGNLRMTRFNGPDVNDWTILHNAPHETWKPGRWNTLKVRVENDQAICFVNGDEVYRSNDPVLPHGRIGLAAFRGTVAEFRGFTMAPHIPSRQPSPEMQQQVSDVLDRLQEKQLTTVQASEQLSRMPGQTQQVLEAAAAQLDAQAARIRQLADDVHTHRTANRILRVLNEADDQSGGTAENTEGALLQAALLLAQLDNPELRVAEYLQRVTEMAEDIRQQTADDANERQLLQALDDWLFRDNGFHGSRQQYYTRSNSYLNEVIDDREGLPITLSVLYMELGRRLGLRIEGIGLPGHFIVQFQPQHGDAAEWIDVFHRGQRMTDAEVERQVRGQGLRMRPEWLQPQADRRIVERMLRNLLGLAERDRDDSRVLRYLEVLVRLADENPEYRAKRLEMRARTGHPAAALEDVDWFLQQQPAGVDASRLQLLKADLKARLDR